MSHSPEATRPVAFRIASRIPYALATARWFLAWRESHERNAKNITRKNTRRAYERVYRSDSLLAEYLVPARLAFYEEVADKCARLGPRRAIDVGCGTGHLLRLLVDRMAKRPELIVGIDHSRAGIRRASALVPEGRFLVADLYQPPADLGRFDLVLCTEVLEHLREPTHAVEVLCGLSAPGGRIAITVPDGAQDSWEGHVNFWDEHELKAFLAPYGLRSIDRIEDGGVFLAWLAPVAEDE